MIIELESFTRDPRPLELTLRPDEIELDVECARLVGDIGLRGETQSVDGKAHIRGMISAKVESDCARCLEPVAKTLEIEFDDAFIDESQEPTSDEIEVDDLDESIAIDGKIDVDEVVREQIILALPEQTLCRPDCKGLCPKCGGNRNLIDCSCSDEEVDPRWAALKNVVNGK